MATTVGKAAAGSRGGKKRESLSGVPSVAKPGLAAAAAGGGGVVEKPERLDKTQGIQDSDYRLRAHAGASPVIVRTPVPLDVFDYEHLERVEFLASGAFSHVFSARYRGKSVVVKLLREQYKESHVTLKQMRFEQTLLSQLQHPHIVEFVGTGVYNGVPFTVLERLDETLNQRITGEGKPPLALLEALGYAKAIGEALVYLHEQALPGQLTLHRDLKPDNLAFAPGSGAIKLIDFGLARSVPRGTSTDEVYEMTGETGSLRYMAPEVALGMLYNAKADVYSLSLITWQMVQGTKPFQGMSRKDFFHHVVHRHVRPPVTDTAKWPPALSKLVVRSWDPNQLERPTAREYVACLAEIMHGLQHGSAGHGHGGRHHRRNSTGTSTSMGAGAGGSSGMARVRSMFQAMKEKAEDYVGGGNSSHHMNVAASGGSTVAADGFLAGGGGNRRRSGVAATAEQLQQLQKQQAAAAAARRSSSKGEQQQRKPQPIPVPMQVQQPSPPQYAPPGKEPAGGGAPDGGGLVQGEAHEQHGHTRRRSF